MSVGIDRIGDIAAEEPPGERTRPILRISDHFITDVAADKTQWLRGRLPPRLFGLRRQ